MRVAILHDYLNQFGGAERVLLALLELFPNADLYTLLYDEEKTLGYFEGLVTKTSFLDHPWIRRRHRLFIPLMPLAARSLSSKERYDLVISSTAGYSKGFPIRGKFHLSYCHSPLRYAWEIDYLKEVPLSPRAFSRSFAHTVAAHLRKWDKNAARGVNLFIANSHFIEEKIKAYYNREAHVIYPPVNLTAFYPEKDAAPKDYYLMVGRLIYYKRFDLGIKAFNCLKRRLKIIGRGPEEKKLKTLASPAYIEFLGHVSDRELRRYYSEAQALIFPQVEDFGLVAAEAQACGTPILALNHGGAKEIVREGETGLFFTEQTSDAIVEIVKALDRFRMNRARIALSAKQFSKDRFKEQMKEIIRHNGFTI